MIFPPKLIKKPVIFTMAKKYNVIPNIRITNITKTLGVMMLGISGTDATLENARKYLEGTGIKVEPVVGDIIE